MKGPRWSLTIDAPSNGRMAQADVLAKEGEKVVAFARGQLMNRADFKAVVRSLAEQLTDDEKQVETRLQKAWLKVLSEREEYRKKEATGHPDSASEKGTAAAATRLVRLVNDAGVELIHTPEQLPYALLPIDGHRQCWPLRSRSFRNWCRRLFFQAVGAGIGSQAVEDALGVLEGRAVFDGAERAVHVRLAEHEGRTYLDLGDSSWRVVEIATAGWRLVDNPPVLFRRPRALLALPEPVQGGSLEQLRALLNLEGEADWQLVVTWLLQSIRGTGSYPVLALAGEQGSCKSTAARLLRSLIDPNTAALRSPPREVRDLMIAASNSWVVGLDNLSHIPDWLSDLLCCLATGGGYSARELYSDGEETIFNARRPCVLTSIEDVTTRGDLLDRSLCVTLPGLRRGTGQRQRRAEREYWAEAEAARPAILGALLDAACAAQRHLPHVRIEQLPRMADYAELAVATEQALGWPAGSFLAAYQGNRNQAHQVSLESSLITAPLQALLDAQPSWRGTCTELLQALRSKTTDAVTKQREWPSRPNVLSGHLRRLAPDLAAIGIDILFPDRTARSRTLHIRCQEQPRKTASSSSSSSSDHGSADPGEPYREPGDDDPDDDGDPTSTPGNDADDDDDADFHYRFSDSDEAPF